MSRREASTTVQIGANRDVDPSREGEHIHYLSGEVTIDISGAESDGGDVWMLMREIETAVTNTVDEYGATE
jgi:hypothetical protein